MPRLSKKSYGQRQIQKKVLLQTFRNSTTSSSTSLQDSETDTLHEKTNNPSENVWHSDKDNFRSNNSIQNRDILHKNKLQFEDIEIIHQEDNASFPFKPVTLKWQLERCTQLNLKFCKSHTSKACLKMGRPKTISKLIGDGNCFFRAISYALTCKEDYHQLLRAKVISHMSSIEHLLKPYFPNSDDTLETYLVHSRMASNCQWATIVEIFSTAHLLMTDIWTYTIWDHRIGTWTWNKHTALHLDHCLQPTDVANEGIYIQHTNLNHYDYVSEVENSDNCENKIPSVTKEVRQTIEEKMLMAELQHQVKVPKQQNKDTKVPKQENEDTKVPKQQNKDTKVPKQQNKDTKVPKQQNKDTKAAK